ncbi:alpha/beta fold hydrolase [Enterococcus sp. LJL98]
MHKKWKKTLIPLSVVGASVGLTYFLFRNQPEEKKLGVAKNRTGRPGELRQRDCFLVTDDGLPLALTLTQKEGRSPKGIVQVIHGILEHKNRYQDFANYLAQAGYLVVTSDNRGHGESTNAQNPLGHMPGIQRMVADQVAITDFIQTQFPEIPVYLYGHSFGSILARNYLQKHDEKIEKLLLTGTVSYQKLAPVGLKLADFANKFVGEDQHSWLLKKLSGYGNEDSSWLTNDLEELEKVKTDPQMIPGYDNLGVRTIWEADYELKQLKHFACQNPALPILSLSGAEDIKITGGEKGLADTKATLAAIGYQNIEVIEYPNMKHEVLNEIEKHLVYQRILSFFESE